MAAQMFEEVLGIESPMKTTMAEDPGYSGERGIFKLVEKEGSLQILLMLDVPNILPAKICQDGDNLKVELNTTNATLSTAKALKAVKLTVTAKNPKQIKVDVHTPFFDRQYHFSAEESGAKR